jgi:serine/threonine protein kinase
MKMVDVEKHPDAKQTVRKETAIHRMLSNPNIIQYFGKRSEPNMEYIFLEYASGGELFDRIGRFNWTSVIHKDMKCRNIETSVTGNNM